MLGEKTQLRFLHEQPLKLHFGNNTLRIHAKNLSVIYSLYFEKIIR